MTEKIDLNKYTKSEIIEAIERLDETKYYFNHLKEEVKKQADGNRGARIHENAMNALEESNKAMNDYLNWWRKAVMIIYGDGKSVAFNDLPPTELKIGTDLERAWKEAEEKRKITSKLEADMYKELLGGER